MQRMPGKRNINPEATPINVPLFKNTLQVCFPMPSVKLKPKKIILQITGHLLSIKNQKIFAKDIFCFKVKKR